MSPAPSSPTRRPDIQGLRAVAVLLVVLAHARVAGLAGGFVGVDVFFVISGSLITGLLLREAESTGTVRLREFYARRARRILLAAALTVVAVMAYAAVRLPVDRVSALRADAASAAAFVANLHFARAGADYFAATDSAESPLQHFWSLAVEEQFYLIWPVLLVLAVLVARRLGPRARRGVVAGVLVAGSLGSLAWSVHVTATSPTAAYFSTPARVYELGLGGLLAVVGAAVPARLRTPVGLAGLAGLAGVVVTVDGRTPWPGWHGLLPVAATLAVLAAGPDSAAGRLLSTRPLRWVGDRSYSLYLWHWPVLVLGREALPAGWPPTLTRGVLVALSLAIAAASYRLVELPFLRQQPSIARGLRALVLWPVVLGVALGSSAAAYAYSEHQLVAEQASARSWYAAHPSARVVADPRHVRASLRAANRSAGAGAPIPPDLDIDAMRHDVWERSYTCLAWWSDSTSRICPVGDAHARRTVVLWGDSHAGMWLPALDDLGRRQHVRVIPLLKPSCAPYDIGQRTPKMPAAACASWRTWSLDRIRRIHPDQVVVAARGYFLLRPPAGTSKYDAWRAGVRATILRLEAVTPSVTVLSDIPIRPTTALDCVTVAGATERDCLAPELGNPSTQSNPATRAGLAGTSARWVDVDPLVCQSGQCPLVVGDLAVYYDDDHLSVSWARFVANALGRRLGPLARTSPA